jgi:hypothetical protein
MNIKIPSQSGPAFPINPGFWHSWIRVIGSRSSGLFQASRDLRLDSTLSFVNPKLPGPCGEGQISNSPRFRGAYFPGETLGYSCKLMIPKRS